MASATTGPAGGARGRRAEGGGLGLVRFASVLLVVMGVLARAACLLTGALMVRPIRAFLATPGPADKARAAPGWPDGGACMRRQCTELAAGQCRGI
jgi:hypothetical protein